ncbi:hypothetical protein [Enterococcus sp. AZ196]|uniref:hypothetical protein n=1 Tax=Enterococcus sp. AZ196 TaxID=2774659 RepID=UPI003D2C64D4
MITDKQKYPKSPVIEANTKRGKQKIQDLVQKHKNGVEALENNVSKDQVKAYSKELKKLGVDFSVQKVGKDNYSFFFATKDVGVIEKALKNVVEKKSLEVSKKSQLPIKEKELEDLKEKTDLVSLEGLSEDEKNEKFTELYRQLSKEEKEYFKQIVKTEKESADNFYADRDTNFEADILAKMKNDLSDKQQDSVQNLYDTFVTNNSEKNELRGKISNKRMPDLLEKVDVKLFEESEATKVDLKNLNENQKLDKFESMYDELSPVEKQLFNQKNLATNELKDRYFNDSDSMKETQKLFDLKDQISDQSYQKTNNLYNLFVKDDLNTSPEQKDKLAINKIKEKIEQKEKSPNIYSIAGVKAIDKQIKEQEKEQGKEKTKQQDMSR